MIFKLVPLLLGLVPFTRGLQVANLNISESTAAEYGCNSTCYENFQIGLATDAALYGAIYDADFYETASNFSSLKPGDVLKLKPINPTLHSGIPVGTTVYKFQYVSEDLYSKNVPATGFIAFPYASRTNGQKYRTLAYAHGSCGVFRGCAPSTMPNLDEYGSWSFMLQRGYAIIATDYAGLGNNYTAHHYQASPAHAHDLYYSVAAAQSLFGESLTAEWMSVGHSEGGGAVWALAESPLLRENHLCLGEYLGTVAQAPGVRLKELALLAVQTAANSSPSDMVSVRSVLGEFGWLVLGLRSIIPKASQSWLQPTFKKRLELAELAQACYASAQSLVADLDIEDVVDLSDPTFFDALDVMQNLTARGHDKSRQPILVVQGLADVLVLPKVVETSHNASCHSGNEVHLQLYPGLDHTQVIPASAPSFLQWIDDRFGGVKTTGQCSNDTIQPFDLVNMYAPKDTD
ncbi:Alpha/Beta hydrolase protein [Thelonectria olida]|uniref:Alpha/Beta hydrolase protein n=1 Tax=Thelonectria olida TaxID=1576542 RepID=A0A9P9AHR7_9HYPO|nr:Alpha/Beta hydrolase protein [Thelonectria olida]